MKTELPKRIGLCPDPRCAQEFYMPDPTPFDTCPMEHDPDHDQPMLVHYIREGPDED